jgi:hypothetical protein
MSEFKFKNPTVAIDSANKKERDMMKGIMEGSFKDPNVFDGSNVSSKDLGVWGRSDANSAAANFTKQENVFKDPSIFDGSSVSSKDLGVWGKADATNVAANENKKNEEDFKYEGASEGFGGKDEEIEKVATASKAKEDDDFKYEGASEGFGGKEVDSKRLTEVGTEGTETILDSENVKPEVKIERLTEVGTEGTETILDSENIKNSQEARTAEIKKIQGEVDNERKAYLEADFNKNTALSRVRKFFGGIGKYDDVRNKNTMDDPELAQFRAYYDAKLMKLQELTLADAKERGATDEELANIYMNFRGEQKITMATEHDNLRAEKLAGTKEGFLKGKIVSLVNAYNALPTSKKIGIGLAMMAGGAAAAGIGGAAIGAMTSFAAARRIFGGIVAGRGATLALEARGQKKDSEKLENDRQKILEQIRNLDPAKKYDFLTDNLNKVIKDDENSIDKIKNQDIRQLATGAAVGAFVGSGMLGKLVSAGYHEAADYFKSIFGGGDPTSHIEAVKETVKGALGHIEVHSGGDSIEKSLIEYIKAHPEMGIDNPGEAAHTMATDYAKASGVPFDKLNHIYPAATFDVDPNTHQIVNMQAKYMPDHLPTAEPVANSEPQQQFAPRPGSVVEQPPVEPTKEFAPRVGSVPTQPEILPIDENAEFEKGAETDLGAEKVEVAEEITKLENEYNNATAAATEAHKVTTETPGTFVSEANNTEVFDNFDKEANIRENIKLTDNKLHQLFEERGILESPDTVQTVKVLRMDLFGGSSEAFKNVGELKMDDFLADTKNEVSSGDSSKYTEKIWNGKNSILEFSKEVPPRTGETVSHWTLRVVEETAKVKK